MPDDGIAGSDITIRSTLEHAALTLPQQRRLDELRERHHDIEPLGSGPGGTLEATVELSSGKAHIFLEDPDELLDRIEEVIDADPDTS